MLQVSFFVFSEILPSGDPFFPAACLCSVLFFSLSSSRFSWFRGAWAAAVAAAVQVRNSLRSSFNFKTRETFRTGKDWLMKEKPGIVCCSRTLGQRLKAAHCCPWFPRLLPEFPVELIRSDLIRIYDDDSDVVFDLQLNEFSADRSQSATPAQKWVRLRGGADHLERAWLSATGWWRRGSGGLQSPGNTG